VSFNCKFSMKRIRRVSTVVSSDFHLVRVCWVAISYLSSRSPTLGDGSTNNSHISAIVCIRMRLSIQHITVFDSIISQRSWTVSCLPYMISCSFPGSLAPSQTLIVLQHLRFLGYLVPLSTGKFACTGITIAA